MFFTGGKMHWEKTKGLIKKRTSDHWLI